METTDVAEIWRVRALLDDRGIPTSVTQTEYPSKYTAMDGRPKVMGIWVYFPEQLDDARELLKNPLHNVEKRINIKKFYTDINKMPSLSITTMVAIILTILGIATMILTYSHALPKR